MRTTAILVSVALLAAGCTGPRLTYDSAPAARPEAGVRTLAAGSANVVVIAPFEDPPSNAMGWNGLGAAMSDTMVRSLRNDARVDVRVLASTPAGSRDAKAASVLAAHPDADYLVIGRVTDFHHVKEIADGSLRRLGLFGKRNEAFAAVELEVIRLDTGELARQDHLHGTAEVPSDLSFPAGYSDLSPRSYLFWSTPLGRASREALDEAIAVVETLPGTQSLRLEVVASISPREIRIAGGRRAGLVEGDRLRLVAPDAPPIVDPATGRAIEARILSLGRDDSVAYLSGEPPRSVNLVGCRVVPADSRRTASATE